MRYDILMFSSFFEVKFLTCFIHCKGTEPPGLLQVPTFPLFTFSMKFFALLIPIISHYRPPGKDPLREATEAALHALPAVSSTSKITDVVVSSDLINVSAGPSE